MKALKRLLILWSAIILAATVAALTLPASATEPGTPAGAHQVVSDLGQLEMLNADQQMLQQMRRVATPNMVTMIETDPMWTDPDMIRLQEEYQGQLDRMIGKRPGQP